MEPTPRTRSAPTVAAAADRLTFRARFEHDATTLVLAGELDCASAGVVDAAIAGIRAAGASEIRVDTEDVSFIDCAGLDALHRAAVELAAEGGSLQVVRPSRSVARLVHLAQVAALLSDGPDGAFRSH